MKAELVLARRLPILPGIFVELVIWEVPRPVSGSRHSYKYRLALVADDVCVMRYDNETGKGDHIHEGASERPYRFKDLDSLQADFFKSVERWLERSRS
jgi:hypothetical protein